MLEVCRHESWSPLWVVQSLYVPLFFYPLGYYLQPAGHDYQRPVKAPDVTFYMPNLEPQ